jgi:hypothetical protein
LGSQEPVLKPFFNFRVPSRTGSKNPTKSRVPEPVPAPVGPEPSSKFRVPRNRFWNPFYKFRFPRTGSGTLFTNLGFPGTGSGTLFQILGSFQNLFQEPYKI